MIDTATVRRIALALPEVEEIAGEHPFKVAVRGKGLAWTYLARLVPKGPRVPHPHVLAVRCSLPRKEMLIEAAPDRFFDDDHYRNYPAVLVRLDVVDEDELAGLLTDAWRLVAPKALAKRHATT